MTENDTYDEDLPGPPTYVLRFGALWPTQGIEAYEEQLRLKHKYYNDLIGIERVRRRAVYDAGWNLPELETDRVRLEVLRDQIDGLYRQKKRLEGVAAKREFQEHDIDPLQAERALIWKGLKAARERLRTDPQVQAACQAATARALEAIKAARAAASQRGHALYPGNYLLAEAAAKQAAKTNPKKKKGEPPIPWYEWPRFRSWRRTNGAGRVGVQIPQGLAVPDAFWGQHTQLRLEPVAALPEGVRSSRRRDPKNGIGRTCVHIRVASTGKNNAPVWLTLPVVLHRSLPADGVIRDAQVQRYQVGTRLRYELTLTIVLPPRTVAIPAPSSESATVAIDLGWRRRQDGGLRTGYWCDSQGQHGELVLPPEARRQQEHAFSLISQRQDRFNAFMPCLLAWLDQHRSELPEDLQEEVGEADKWKHPDRLWRLAEYWRRNRFPADVTFFPSLADWRYRDYHLHNWAANEMNKVCARRDDLYRCWASEIVSIPADCHRDARPRTFPSQYHRAVLEKFDLRRVIKEQAAGDADEQAASSHRHLVAPNKFRLALKNACVREGVEVMEVPPEYTTLTCHLCGHVDEFDAAASLTHTCSQCHGTWDQDYNACKNLLSRASAVAAKKSEDNGVESKKKPRRGGWRRWHARRRAKDLSNSTP